MMGPMTAILGGLAPARFLRDYWHKRPLLVRQAIPGFAGLLDRDSLLSLAARPDAISRLVMRRKRWSRYDGPFELSASALPRSNWTVLVHGIESLIPGGWELLRQFSFIPSARIDDLMVSYAAPGGSVGPHEDRYDAFLLQGPGRRRWQISTHNDHVLDDKQAIKVLKNFVPDEEWLLEPGDMLYVPPGVAHWGIAEGPCFTYSIGFLAPSHVDLMQSFLGYLAQALGHETDPDLLFDPPDLRLQRDPLEVSDAMARQATDLLRTVKWDSGLVEEFLGCFLTRPKPHVVFTPPARPLPATAFSRRGRVELALPSRGLTRKGLLFFNGEAHRVKRATLAVFKRLVSERRVVRPLALDDQSLEMLHAWYLAGYLTLS